MGKERQMSGINPAGGTRVPSGRIEVLSPPGVVEVLPGYQGPRSADDFDYELPPRVWAPIGSDGRPEIAAPGGHQPPSPVSVEGDGRSYTVDQIYSGQRFIVKVDALNVGPDASYQNLFSTHLGRTFSGKPHWTEIGIARFAGDPTYHLYTFTQNQLGDVGWGFFGTAQVGDVFEFVIRLNESDPGPYRYETLCSGTRVRQGVLPELNNQVDLSHEMWTYSDAFSGGDYMIAVEGWVNYPPGLARWYAPDLNIGVYSTNPPEITATLETPFAYKFTSGTP
jgi:hypothetical protein